LFIFDVHAKEIFLEALYGHSSSYAHEANLINGDNRSSEFEGVTTGARIGFFSKTWAFSLEHKPEQEVSDGNNEQVSKVSSNSVNIEYALFLGKTYMIGAGVFTGTMSFELIKDANGAKYTNPPKLSGATYGAIYSIRFQLSDHVHIGIEYKNGRGDIEGNANSSTGIETTSIKIINESNVYMGYTF
jgi:hypothetical protein